MNIPANRPAERIDDYILSDGRSVHLCAYGYETRYSWGHIAFCPELGICQKITYYNRTWEAHRFDTVIRRLKEKVEKAIRPRRQRRPNPANLTLALPLPA